MVKVKILKVEMVKVIKSDGEGGQGQMVKVVEVRWSMSRWSN